MKVYDAIIRKTDFWIKEIKIMVKKKLDWVAITGILTVVATIISFLVFLFGEGVFRGLSFQNSKVPTTQIAQTTTVINELPYQKVEINQSISSLNGLTIVTIKYLEFQKNTLLLRLTFDNSQNSLNELACGLPKLVKSQYGDLGDAIEKGGAYIDFGKTCVLGFPSNIISMKSKEDSWLIFQIDTSRFTVNGLYTLDNLGEYIPTFTFEITDTP